MDEKGTDCSYHLRYRRLYLRCQFHAYLVDVGGGDDDEVSLGKIVGEDHGIDHVFEADLVGAHERGEVRGVAGLYEADSARGIAVEGCVYHDKAVVTLQPT